MLSKAKFWEKHGNEKLNDRQWQSRIQLLNVFDGKPTSLNWADLWFRLKEKDRDIIGKGLVVFEETSPNPRISRPRPLYFMVNQELRWNGY